MANGRGFCGRDASGRKFASNVGMSLLRFSALLALAAVLAGCNAPTAGNAPANNRGATASDAPADFPTRGARETGRRSRAARQAAESAPGAFDYYLLTLSWSPEYCHNHQGAAQCVAHSRFVLHGLWPENADGTYPENCTSDPLPSPTPPNAYPDPRLAAHEWATHGTCTGLTAAAYFNEASTAFASVKIPPAFAQGPGPGSLSADSIVAQFQQVNPGLPQGSVVVSCASNYLSAVEVCLDKNLHGVACGAGLHSCNAGVVKVPMP